VALEILVDSHSSVDVIELGIGLFSVRGFELASWTNTCSNVCLSLTRGLNVFRVEYVDLVLLPSQYVLGIGLRSGRGLEDYVAEAVSFEVVISERSATINAHSFGGLVLPKVLVSRVG
jgi:hypothetical protein